MKNKLVNDIISILNNDSYLCEKQDQIRSLYKYRRTENRNLLKAVCSMLDEHILPMKYDETIRLHYTDSLSDKNYIQLSQITEKSKCSYFNGICNEVLWDKYHKFNFAKQSILSYNQELIKPTTVDNHKFAYAFYSIGVCRVYSRCKVPEFDFESFFNNTIAYIKCNYNKHGYFILFILEALCKCKEHFDIIENTYLKVIDYYEINSNYEKACTWLESLAKFCSATKSKTNDIYIRIALNREKQASLLDWSLPQNSHNIINLIHQAMVNWEKSKDLKSSKERKRLAKIIEPVKVLLLESMQSISSVSIDLSEYIDKTNTFISKATIESVIYKLAYIVPLKSFDEMKSKVQNSDSVFKSVFTVANLDSKGRLRCIVPATMDADENEMTKILEHEAMQEYTYIADAFIKRYIWLAKENNIEFTKENLKFLVENNAFIPQDRQDTFLNGLVAGFNLDLATSMHLLMPQIENCIRIFAEDCGAVVFKTYPNGVEECLALSSILCLQEVIDSFDNTFLFNLKLFYVSEYGFGMRDIICHSLYSDNELQTSNALAVWWFTLHICCMYSSQLIKRLNDQKNT